MDHNIAVVNKKPFSLRLKKSIPHYILIAPAILWYVFFHYMPIYGIQISFRHFNPIAGMWNSQWAGFHYFSMFLRDAGFWRVMRNTVLLNIYGLIFAFPFPIIFALFLNELRSKAFMRVSQTISYLPYFISWVVVASIWRSMLSPSSGVVNQILGGLGIEPIYFLAKAEYFRTILIAQGVWKGFGMSAVYYIAALAGIDQELYQAAAIDGAGRLKQTWHITLPGLRNIVIVLFVLNLGGMISSGFEQPFLMYNPMVYETGDVIGTYVYRIGLEKAQYSYTAAISLTQNIVGFVLVYSANRLSRVLAGWSLW